MTPVRTRTGRFVHAGLAVREATNREGKPLGYFHCTTRCKQVPRWHPFRLSADPVDCPRCLRLLA